MSSVGSADDNDTSYSVRGGYYFTPNIAVEGFYSNFFDKSATDGTTTADLKLSAIGVGIVGKKNFGADGKPLPEDGVGLTVDVSSEDEGIEALFASTFRATAEQDIA